MNFLKSLIAIVGLVSVSAFFGCVAATELEAQQETNIRPFHYHKASGLTPFLYSKVNRALINMWISISTNLPDEVSPALLDSIKAFITGTLVIHPSRIDAASLATYIKKLDLNNIKTNNDAKVFFNKVNNYFRKAIGLPRFKEDFVDRNYRVTFEIKQARAFFEYLQIAASVLPENPNAVPLDAFTAAIDLAKDLLPGNPFTVFLTQFIASNPPNLKTGTDVKQFLCQLHNGYSAASFYATIDCAEVDKYYGPNTIAW